MERFSQAAQPRHFFVNVSPWLQFVPEWFPGAGWKKTAREWRQPGERMYDIGYEWTLEQIVCTLEGNCLVLTFLISSETKQSHTFLHFRAFAIVGPARTGDVTESSEWHCSTQKYLLAVQGLRCDPLIGYITRDCLFQMVAGWGQAVDIVLQAGKLRTISGFQTHLSLVRLGQTDRAELGTEEYLPFVYVLEGLVVLQKNPGYEKEDRMEL